MPCSSFKLQPTAVPYLDLQIHETILGKHLQVQRICQSTSFTPPEVSEPLTTHSTPVPITVLSVLPPLTADQGPFAGSFLDQSISIGISHGSSFSVCYFKAIGWWSLTVFPRAFPRPLVFSAGLFSLNISTNLFSFYSIFTAPKVSGLTCTFDHVISPF